MDELGWESAILVIFSGWYFRDAENDVLAWEMRHRFNRRCLGEGESRPPWVFLPRSSCVVLARSRPQSGVKRSMVLTINLCSSPCVRGFWSSRWHPGNPSKALGCPRVGVVIWVCCTDRKPFFAPSFHVWELIWYSSVSRTSLCFMKCGSTVPCRQGIIFRVFVSTVR